MAPKNARSRKNTKSAKPGAGAPSAGAAGLQEVIPRRFWGVLFFPGLALVTAGAVMAVVYSLTFVQRAEEPGGMHLPFIDEYPTVTDILMPPFIAYFIGGILLFIGEMLRRGAIIAGVKANVAVFRPLATLVHVAWALALVGVWGVIMFELLPQLSLGTAEHRWLSEMDADSDPIFLIGVYGGLAAALAGALLGSLFKKLWYRAAIRRLGPTEQISPFWWSFCFHWRADTGLVALGATFLGLSPIMFLLETVVGQTVTLGVGSALVVAGLLTATMYRSTGMPLGGGSSLAPSPGEPA